MVAVRTYSFRYDKPINPQTAHHPSSIIVSMAPVTCPCCSRPIDPRDGADHDPFRCDGCGHHWRHPGAATATDYGRQKGRNAIGDPSHARKLQDRLSDISPLLRAGARVLEIGCAEGSLGSMLRQVMPGLHYTGVELSDDAVAAAGVLDWVIRTPTASLEGEKFDLLLSFHVLEHIAGIRAEASCWRRLIADDGYLVVEVPDQAGHALLDRDPNPEHLHQFNAASIAALLRHAGFEIDRIESGHWESAVYSNSLRVIARPALASRQRRDLLLRRFRKHLPDAFAAWGIGGDFRAYVEPLLPLLPVAALVDAATEKHGQRHGSLVVEAYDPQRHGSLAILVCSVRHRRDILQDLVAQGIPSSRIVTLDDIFGSREP